MIVEKELKSIYQEIAETVNKMIPEEWEKFYFYAQISDTGGGTYFFYNTPNNLNDFQYSVEIPYNFTVNRNVFDEYNNNLFDLADKMREVFKKHEQELWYSFTMSLERSGKFNIHFDYTDWFKTDYDFNEQLDIWEYKYLGKEPTDPRKQKLIEKYLEEFPDNPI